jgi:hypothetical protein
MALILRLLNFFLTTSLELSATLRLAMYGDFVIQLRKDSDPALGQFRGRIEHIDSGFSGTFQSLEDLRDLIVQLLAKVASHGQES